VNGSLLERLVNNESGASVVRVVLVIVVLAALILGIVNLAWIVNGYITINGAAREGARVAVVNNESPAVITEINETVKANAGAVQVRDEDIEINYAQEVGGQTEVTASGELDLLISFSPLPKSVSLQGSAVLRQTR